MHLEVQGEVSIAELRHAFRQSRQLGRQPVGVLQQLVALGFVAAGGAQLIVGHNVLFGVLCWALALVLFFPRLLLLPWELYWQYAVLPGEYEQNRGLFQVRLLLDDSGLHLHDALEHAQDYPWSTYAGAVEDEAGFLLHGGPALHFIPRRFFTVEQAHEFSAFLEKRFGEDEGQAPDGPGTSYKESGSPS
jgi:hypothetical protein